ncbi:3-hydroxyacyl-CoA dehydrogenase NAD-binding domain-containing protein [Conexibacter woesei]|uniref:3-hydroxybutyryl-CoA dehydrogenase n=1 Tax=Conexibacter woesei (strain DSM 14684 / CCUG 47730 / CIP 108061 / JCM 11494 / NBRC 100937 / ID131577) TaxID=469383 RepID=D3F5E8_CONWI|nr:3-hydroxyacyl-CoA dehydrogenase NAD-binding domain-containing protein [Conexibacter woesei]ADB50615.1 3-hydroxybutyryl-CoA dehydrogenase [Conexibacter woesei DSM 14684]
MAQTARSVDRLGVAGAGTMGAGIAQTALLAGIPTVLTDPSADALAHAEATVSAALARGAERGRWSTADADAARTRLTCATDPAALAGVDAAIEAVPERLELKRTVFAQLADVCGPATLLATNTSSLLVSAVAAGLPAPERVVGLHFFNPVPLMRLVEVIAGADTGPEALASARALGERLGKRVVVAQDGIGFLVNRCGRPFVGEALRLLQERVATIEQIDRICRMGGGFRMGPFELADLIGLDVNLEIAESFWRQSYGEPRWKPSPLQARLVAAGRHGRKSGAGFHDYRDGAHRPADPEPPAPGGGDGRSVVIGGAGPVADGLRARARTAGFAVLGLNDRGADDIHLCVDADPRRRTWFGGLGHVPARALLCASTTLRAARDVRACGFHLVGPVDQARLVETTALPDTDPAAVARTEEFFGVLGFHVERVGDAPGMVLGRIVAQLVNEAAFAIGEGVGSAADVDAGTTLGLNHPRGPVAWSEQTGLAHVRAILRTLHDERGEERYRTAPLLLGAESLAAHTRFATTSR